MATGSAGLPGDFPRPGHRLLGPLVAASEAGLPAGARARPASRSGGVNRSPVVWVATPRPSTRDSSIRFGFGARYNSVKRFCRALRTREPEQFDRLEFLAGEECQVDYGEGAPTRHPGSGRYRKPRLFVMTLR